MVKRHRLRGHPLHAYRGLMLGEEEEYGGSFQPDLRETITVFAVNQSSTPGWSTLDLSGLAPPAAAIAAVLDVMVRDADGAATDSFMQFATPGIIYDSKAQIVYAGDVNDRWQARLVIVEISDLGVVAMRITGSAAGFDYNCKLIGWIIDPSVTRPTMPSEDLFCKFRVVH